MKQDFETTLGAREFDENIRKSINKQYFEPSSRSSGNQIPHNQIIFFVLRDFECVSQVIGTDGISARIRCLLLEVALSSSSTIHRYSIGLSLTL